MGTTTNKKYYYKVNRKHIGTKDIRIEILPRVIKGVGSKSIESDRRIV